MFTDRVFAWARVQPEKLALLWNDMPLSYAMFARAIEACRRFFERQGLPHGGTAIVLFHNLSDAWVAVLALRALGMTTVAVPTVAEAEALALKDVACLVIAEADQGNHLPRGNGLAGPHASSVPPRSMPGFTPATCRNLDLGRARSAGTSSIRPGRRAPSRK